MVDDRSEDSMSVSTLSFGVNRPTISCIFDCKLHLVTSACVRTTSSLECSSMVRSVYAEALEN